MSADLIAVREHQEGPTCLAGKQRSLGIPSFTASIHTDWEGQRKQLGYFFSFLYFSSVKGIFPSFQLSTDLLFVCFSAFFFFFLKLLNLVSPAKLPTAPVLFIILSTERNEKERILEEKQKPAISLILNYPVACRLGTRGVATLTHTAENWVC